MYGKNSAGVSNPPLIDAKRRMVTKPEGGKYEGGAVDGNIFHMTLAAWTTTIAAGNINSFAAAASSQFALWNPVGSGKNIVLLKFATWPISGTAPVAGCFHSQFALSAVLASVALTPVTSAKIGSGLAPTAGYKSSAAGGALTGSGAATLIRAADFFITAGTAANLTGQQCTEYIDGDIVLTPGYGWAPTWVAAGTTYLGGYSVTWKEVDA